MKNKKGFTLVELLAIVIILAIILVIVVPIANNVIEDSKKNAFKSSAIAIINEAKRDYQNDNIGALNPQNKVYTFVNGISSELKLSGELPKSGTVEVDSNGNVELSIQNDKYCAIKRFNENNVKVYELNDSRCGITSKIHLVVNLNGGVTSQEFANYYDISSELTLEEPTRENHKFNGWDVEGAELDDNVLLLGDVDATIHANWTYQPFLTIVLDNGEETTKERYAPGTEVTLEEPEKDGYIFIGWTISGTGSGITGNTVTIGSKDTTLTANYVEESFVNIEYAYKGEYQMYTVLKTGTYKIELWGASGGDGLVNGKVTNDGGNAGYTSGNIYLTRGEKLYFYVGSEGGTPGNTAPGGAAGYNGGGTGGMDGNETSSTEPGGGGGGATDVRYFGSSTITSSDLLWDSTLGLRSRIMVAAGGAGGSYNGDGGNAGGLEGYIGVSSTSKVGFQTTGHSFGIGGNGVDTFNAGPGAGGGGYYGGDAGDAIYSSGSGGSSFISGHVGSIAITSDGTHKSNSLHYSEKYFTDTIIIDGSGYNWTDKIGELVQMPNTTGETYSSGVGHTGDGYAKITLVNSDTKTEEQIDEEKEEITKNGNFAYTGTYQKFVVPKTGTYKIELWGASGGQGMTNGSLNSSRLGGSAGYVSGTIELQKDDVYYIYIGGKGGNAMDQELGGEAGYNGGAIGGTDGNVETSANEPGAGSGGATDIRYFSSTPTTDDLLWNSTLGLNSRIMVAAGGAGGSYDSAGGYGGGLSGGQGTATSAVVGSQTTGNAFGIGGAGPTYNAGTSAGGAGYYGGYSGQEYGDSGSGGSSFISGHTGCVAITSSTDTTPRTGTDSAACTDGIDDNLCSIHYSGKTFTDTLMIDGEGYTWTNTVSTTVGTNLMPHPYLADYTSGVGHTGNGYAKITLIQ